jgi:iron complex outermembrane recepter protein
MQMLMRRAPDLRARTRCVTLGILAVCFALAALHATTARGETAAPNEDLTRLSLQDLSNLEVTSVSKAAEGLQRASASIYVITHEAIMRSGATSVMEALRLAPNFAMAAE